MEPGGILSSTASEQSIAGPSINGKFTRVILFSAAQFSQYPFVEQVKDLINASFRITNVDYFQNDRFTSAEHYLEFLGNQTFTYVVISEEPDSSTVPTIYGVGSARVFAGSPKKQDRVNRWVYVQAPGVDLATRERWELKTLAVNPNAFRQGLGGYILRLIEQEIKRRFDTANPQEQQMLDERSRTCQVVLTTLREINHRFYHRHGYHMDFETYIDGSQDESFRPFHIASMSKVL